ncbi:MAG: hypothetical protein P0Y56_07515 [Candidatus Andeanibacterium colombiense]|uniref:Uncharacterized protein n=1 Tax=Candidatus Andeanibacterium colombiense TaxID=3121345 RepID=A0AAJ5X8Q8_9SPHN|nr:MAG: hypothetical protein P0Y56_07515 [Sphingomonadaceae bacterium]
MIAGSRRRGQPVLALVVLLGGWIALRAAQWETPFAQVLRDLPRSVLTGAAPALPVAPTPFLAPRRQPDPRPIAAARDWPVVGALPAIATSPAERAMFDLPDPLRPRLEPFLAATPLPRRLAAAHTMLMMSGLAALPLPPELARLIAPRAGPGSAAYQPLTTFAASPSGGRWSADGWVLLRRDTETALTSGRGSYGRSQAGAVLRYALAPSSPLRPMAYARVSGALGGTAESELAVGLSARPVAKLPVRLAAELRATRAATGFLARPAGYAVTELPGFALPLRFTGEAYGQAGYVGGRYSSAFADGQIRAERRLAELGTARLSAGGGAWGGAQKGAARLDLGPTASVQLKLGPANPRLSMDWRFRVAGNAEPASGPALTISAGF